MGDVVRELGKEIRVLHVHDNRNQIDLHLPPFYGRIDWYDFANALREIQYTGVFSFEIDVPVQYRDFYEIAYKYYADIAKHLLKQ